MNNDTHKDSTFLTGSTVVVQREDRGPWMHGVIIEGNSDNHQGQSFHVWMMKTGRIVMQITNNTQGAKSRTQKLVTFQSTDHTNYDILYNQYTAHTHMYMNHGRKMIHGNSDEHNQFHNNNSDGNHKSMVTQQDNVGVNTANMLHVEDNVGMNNTNIPQVEYNNGP